MRIRDITGEARRLTPNLTPPHERVLLGEEESSGYRGVIALHSSVLGPAVGGTRLWRYASLDDAVVDALRLSRGMTYKNALAGLPLGGGKAVILADGAPDRTALFRAHGRFVDSLGGAFVTAEDVGTTLEDMDIIATETRHVAGASNGLGDPSPFTARGVFCAIRAAAQFRWGEAPLAGRTVAIQGLGGVGYHLARELAAAGAHLVVTDIDARRADRVVLELAAQQVPPDAIYDVAADIFAPCALGGVLNDATIPRLRVTVVAGGANNQLAEDKHGDALHARGILFVPDYAANAGGVTSGSYELLGWDEAEVKRAVDAIGATVGDILQRSHADGTPPYRAANRIVEERLARATITPP